MGYTLKFRGAVPKPLPQPSADLNGDGQKDVNPVARDFDSLEKFGALSLKNGWRQIPFSAAPRSILTAKSQLPPFQNVKEYAVCTDPAALFYPPQSKSLLSFATGMRVALLFPDDGKIHYPMTITGFVVGYQAPHFTPVMERGRVVVQAIEAQGEVVRSQTLVKDLVWVMPNGERVNPNWVLAAPPKIPQSAAEKLLKPLFEEVKELGTVPDPKVRLQKIDAAIEKWASVDEDPERTQQLMTPPMRDALRRALGLLSGLAPKEL